MMFKKNMHVIDRITRALLAVMLLYFGFIDTSWVASEIIPMILGIFGIVNMVAAISGFCPVYTLANLDFSKLEKET